MKPYWEHMDLEGYRNLWVIKPAAQNCGRGIVIMKSLDDIATHLKSKMDTHFNSRYVIQKYIGMSHTFKEYLYRMDTYFFKLINFRH